MSVTAAVTARRELVQTMWKDHTMHQIAKQLGEKQTTIAADVKALRSQGLVGLKLIPGQEDVLVLEKKARARLAVAKVRDMRRFKVTPVPLGEATKLAPASATGTIYPNTVEDVTPASVVFKSGAHNSKIGGRVLTGWLKGAFIFTLTLEERATCPRSCKLWTICMGNALQYSTRWRPGPVLEAKIALEVMQLIAKYGRILIRLHITGDFYSWNYLKLWAKLLDEHEELHVFGFSAHQSGTQMGDGIHRLREVYPQRFAIRTSDVGGEWGSFTIDFPTSMKMIGDAVVCPEQQHAMNGTESGMHCGSCGMCWKSKIPIVFVVH